MKTYQKVSLLFLASFTVNSTLLVSQASANPSGGIIAAGSASISQPDSAHTIVNQSSDRAVINWQNFNIGSGEVTQFNQPNSQSIILNRVLDGNPSTIFGQLNANGRVVIVNPQGIWFGPGSSVNVSSLIATTADISDHEFMTAKTIDKESFTFSGDASKQGNIVNHGTINAADNGLVALLAPGVENQGVINARMGTVVLASGAAFTLDLNGDQLINFQINKPVATSENNFSDAQKNQMKQITNQGVVAITPTAAASLVENVINTSGVQEASYAVKASNGDIVLMGGDKGVVRTAGTIDVSGKQAGQKGGKVKVLGETVHVLNNAKIDASGDAGGGQVLIGGGYQGKDGTPTSKYTSVDATANINANAINTGNGGQVVVWSDGVTDYRGYISSRGGAISGDGGNVEVSGKGYLNFKGLADIRAPSGKGGTLLLDPQDVIIDGNPTDGGFSGGANNTYTPAGFSPSHIFYIDLLTQLSLTAGGQVVVQTNGAGGTAAGNITVSAPAAMMMGTNENLVLTAANDIFINSVIQLFGSNSSLTLNAPNNIFINAINIAGAIQSNAGATGNSITLNASFGNPANTGAVFFGATSGTFINIMGGTSSNFLSITSAVGAPGGLQITGPADSRISISNTVFSFSTLTPATGGGGGNGGFFLPDGFLFLPPSATSIAADEFLNTNQDMYQLGNNKYQTDSQLNSAERNLFGSTCA